MREILESNKVNAEALRKMQAYHQDVLSEVKAAVGNNKIVVVGMKHNPFVGKARKILDQKNMPYKYLEYGSYWSQWKPRLSIKLWSGWPTFPQVFIDGILIGGANDLQQYLDKKS